MAQRGTEHDRYATRRLRDQPLAVIVAMMVMRMMQAPVDEIVGVVVMRNRVVSTIGSVDVASS